MTQSFAIKSGLFLVACQPEKAETKPAAPKATHHLAIIDCSGSMSYELTRIKDQLKKRLPTLLGAEDTFSLIWFSGRGECGILLEAEPVATLTDLQKVNTALDRWLRPVGLTGFKDPLDTAAKLADKLSKTKPVALLFLSDGCDNQSSRGEILKAVADVGAKVASATFVEYGYYADRPLLAKMAETCGGSTMFAQNFDQYAPQFEAAMKRRPVGVKKVEVEVEGDAVGGFVYAMGDGELTTYAVEGGKVEVPPGTTFYYLNPTSVGTKGAPLAELANPKTVAVPMKVAVPAAYAAVSLYAGRMAADTVLALLGGLGDVALVEEFGGCFGKQRYSAFQETAKQAAFGQGQMTKGYDPKAVPPDDAFTVLDLLSILAEDDGNRVLLDSPEFVYQRIGRATVDAQENLSADEQAQVDALTDEMSKAGKDAKKVAALAAQIAAISAKAPGLKFVPDISPDGYAITNLVYNEERPNVSIQVRKTGTVDLAARLTPEALAAQVPSVLDTFIYRAYTIIKDGIVNVAELPVRVTKATAAKLEKLLPESARPVKMTVSKDWMEGTIRLSKLPVVNRQMIKSVSAEKLFTLEWELTKARARQKVYKAYLDERQPGGKKSAGFEAQYGSVAAAWLKEQGITDYSGFGPKRVQAEATDFYMSKELNVGLKGLSSLPTLAKAKEAKQKGKVTIATAVLTEPMEQLDLQLPTVGDKAGEAAFMAYLEQGVAAEVANVRRLLRVKAAMVFSIVVGQVWIFPSLDETTMTLKLDGRDVEGKAELNEKKVTI